MKYDLIQRLVALGVHANKTYEDSSEIFDRIPDRLKRHFIRGFLDGDGTIGNYQNKSRVGFVSLNHS